MHSSVFLDRAGAVIRPALLWCDGRTTAECAEITRAAGGEAGLRELVRNPALEGFTLPKVLWLRHHEPGAYARLATVLLAKDFVRYRLTGAPATEPSDASGTLMFDPARLAWSDELLRAVGVSPALLPPVGGSAEVLGRLTAGAARLTGLREGTPVVGGGADNACGAAGVGVVAPGAGGAGLAVASWGTSGTVLAPTAEPLVDPGLRAHTFCHVAPNTWYVMGVILAAGGAFGRKRSSTMLWADVDRCEWRPDDTKAGEMVFIPGGTFLMGSDRHYPEEAPSHRVALDGFWIDRTPVTNRQFKEFVNTTGYVTTAQIVSEAEDPAGSIQIPDIQRCGASGETRPGKVCMHSLARTRGAASGWPERMLAACVSARRAPPRTSRRAR